MNSRPAYADSLSTLACPRRCTTYNPPKSYYQRRLISRSPPQSRSRHINSHFDSDCNGRLININHKTPRQTYPQQRTATLLRKSHNLNPGRIPTRVPHSRSSLPPRRPRPPPTSPLLRTIRRRKSNSQHARPLHPHPNASPDRRPHTQHKT